MNDPRAVLKAAEAVYAAVLTPEAWPSALKGVTDALHASHAIQLASAGAGPPLLASAGVDERDLMRSMAAHNECRTSPLDIAVLPRGTALLRSAMVVDSEYARTEHYNEIIRPLNGWYGLGVRQQGSIAGFYFVACRPRGAHDFGVAEAAMLETLIPHLTMAVDFHYRLAVEHGRQQSLAALLDRIKAGAILTDAMGIPLFANAEARRIAAEGDGLLLGEAGIAATGADDTRRLRSTIAAVAGRVIRSGARHARPLDEGRVVLPRPSGRLPFLLTVLPIWRLGASLPGLPATQVAIFINEPDALPAILPKALADVFALTQRESEVVILLAKGLAPAAIARLAGIGVPSVREYLKRAYVKTGTHNQAALVALVRGFAETCH